ncbi:MAG TPA: DUF2059 domain-containing protein [Cyclobacteriaceae bacterium]|nr:DUF2059 domain-containing protein [Cyclobacteriaceae bacterium]
MKKTLLILFIAITASLSVQAQSKTYTVTLKKYLEASGSMSAFKSAITSMMGSFKSMNNTVPEEVWNELEKEFLSTSLDDLVTMLTPVYEKHMTEADLNEVIKFYNSPAGKKLAEKTPAIMEGSMQAGQTWGAAVGQKVMAKLKEKGY